MNRFPNGNVFMTLLMIIDNFIYVWQIFYYICKLYVYIFLRAPFISAIVLSKNFFFYKKFMLFDIE
jgi:Ca2+/Na+ antiporter